MHKNRFHGILSFYNNPCIVMIDLEMIDVKKDMEKSILVCFNKYVSLQLEIGAQKTSGLGNGQNSESRLCCL